MPARKKTDKPDANKKRTMRMETGKTKALASDSESAAGEFLTTNQGVRILDNQNTLKAGERGPSLLEDFIFREKTTHFDHERIPERIVHARGSAAHGVFKVYKSMAKVTKAGFLCDPARETPVFLRFSTVAGSRGSSDLARDPRGFAAKFYTDEGIFDLVGNNMPVFFIQDAMKFPDLVHAVKPEPQNEIPQASSAHNTFWDFISLMPESMHMIMWVMSDRGIPRSYRMMEGFGVHTFRFINEEGKSTFVKFHWKPLHGVHSVAWDEAMKISGKDPDFHRRDLWDAIDSGAFPQWELGVQLVPEEDEFKFDFDLLDPTKLIPEELVPVERVGLLTLNRNPDNFFAETEQVAFHVGHVVPGIDFTNDPLLQGRLFSYTDTQLKRLGGPNFHEIPINRPTSPVHNNQRDGHMRQTINTGTTSYQPNSIAGGCPYQAGNADGGFSSHAERIDARKIRARSPSFRDHFSQATMFYNSQSDHEKTHLVDALRFELGKVTVEAIRGRMLGLLTQVDDSLAARVAEGLGMAKPKGPELPMNHGVPADDAGENETIVKSPSVSSSKALSMAGQPSGDIKTRKVAILVADGFSNDSVKTMKEALEAKGAVAKLIAPRLGAVQGDTGDAVIVDESFLVASSVMYDAVYIPGGGKSLKILAGEPAAIHFVNEAYKHCKAIAADSGAQEFLKSTCLSGVVGTANEGTDSRGVVVGKESKGKKEKSGGFPERFVAAIGLHRFWEDEAKRNNPA